MALQGPASPGQRAILRGWPPSSSGSVQPAGPVVGMLRLRGLLSSSCHFLSTPPSPGIPSVGAGMLVWAQEWGWGKGGRTLTSETAGFGSHRPKFKFRLYPCWLCDPGQGTSPLGCSISQLATAGCWVVWAEPGTSRCSGHVTFFPLPLSVGAQLVGGH